MIERLIELRKTLNMSQAKFATSIKYTPGAIGDIERGKQKLTDRMIEKINYIHNVAENWLRTGEGEMFLPPKSTYPQGDLLAELSQEYSMTDVEKSIIFGYLRLPLDARKAFEGYVDEVLASFKKTEFNKVLSNN